jgi:hypothetical protein
MTVLRLSEVVPNCGVWNESPGGDVWAGPRLDVPWIKLLRRTLDSRGLAYVWGPST